MTSKYVTLRLGDVAADAEAVPPQGAGAPPEAASALTVAEIAALLVHVRETVAMLTGEADAFSSGVSASTQRMTALMHIEDVRQLKEELVQELDSLTTLALERQERWTETTSTFETRIAGLETQLAASQREASCDPLTGAGNRRTLESTLQEWLESSARQFVVALFDLDDFKTINDTQGHLAGDRVLVELSQAIRSRIRPEDVLVRIGGDEFALLLPSLAPRGADTRLRALVKELPGAISGAGPHPVTVSCGYTEVAAGDTVASLLNRADRALYAAKRQGKNRVSTVVAPFIQRLMHARR